MQGAYHSKTIQNNKIEQHTIQNSTNMKHSYLLSSMTWTVTHYFTILLFFHALFHYFTFYSFIMPENFTCQGKRHAGTQWVNKLHPYQTWGIKSR